ncbi:Uncharacterized protein dnm_034860 [Desulfonema magnum]|uniref:Uncharacterized protein n=1 Tax=Desulfonema magnum TaxID=45655 RepID=A0A975BLH0_9BACT|nr:Uncharacterized protein dnm_034860 [Desulfonema magnum]
MGTSLLKIFFHLLIVSRLKICEKSLWKRIMRTLFQVLK